MDSEQIKRVFDEPKSSSQDLHADLPARVNLRERFQFVPEMTTTQAGEAGTDWNLEVESRYRSDGMSTRPLDLNYGHALAELCWLDYSRCILACRSASDQYSLNDLHLGGRRAVLAVHRYIGRIGKIGGVERSQWLGPVVTAYYSHGGAREFDTSDLMRSSAKRSIEQVRSLIKLGVDVNEENMIGETALSYAAREGRVEVFETLVAAGARTDVSFEGHTLLHDAAAGGSVPIIAGLLVRAGLQINAVSWMGLTPVWHAVSGGRVEAAEYLLAEGADLKIEPCRTASSFPKMKEGFKLVNQAEVVLGPDHRLTKMLRGLDQ